jgi:hypothetical protein
MQFNWVKILLIGAAITIVVTIILQLITPSSPTPVIVQSTASKKNIDGTFSSFSGLSYTGQLPTSSPKTLPLVSLRLSDELPNQIKAFLIAEHKLTQNPELPDIWMGEEYLFSRNNNNAEYIFNKRRRSEPIENAPAIDIVTAQTVAENFIAQKLKIDNLKLLDNQTAYYKVEGSHFEDISSPLADIIEFNYSWTIQGIPVYLPNRFQSSVMLSLDKNNEIVKVSFPLTLPAFEPATINVPVISIPAAMQQLNSGNGSVLNADLVNATSFDVAEVVSGNLNRVSLEYRVDPDLNLAVPYYRFEGLIKNKQGSTYQAQLITPAVASAPQ